MLVRERKLALSHFILGDAIVSNKIGWTDKTANSLVGCTPASTGCTKSSQALIGAISKGQILNSGVRI